MRLDDIEESENVEDRRGAGLPGGRVAMGGGGVLIVALIVMLLGGDPSKVLSGAGQVAPPSIPAGNSRSNNGPQLNDESKRFVSKILKETETVWTKVFAAEGRNYQKPKLIIFSDQVESACGIADSGVGPFYCPGDSQVYIDPTFYNTLEQQLGAGGKFAQAYVIAHEVGHHVQNLLGISEKVDSARRRMSQSQANALSVRMELQADFFAGVWAHNAKELQLTEGDIEEALNAASKIGDDTLQKRATGHVNPEGFTHGTSAQRVKWFTLGYKTGDINQGDTFQARNL